MDRRGKKGKLIFCSNGWVAICLIAKKGRGLKIGKLFFKKMMNIFFPIKIVKINWWVIYRIKQANKTKILKQKIKDLYYLSLKVDKKS